MRVAVVSGKGGTGKTTVAVNLALAASAAGARVQLADCDVEEPNCHVFIEPEFQQKEEVHVDVPVVDPERCTRCGACVEFCRFNALALVGSQLLVFKELCHSCGGCWLVCPSGAITQEARPIGVLQKGRGKGVDFVQGCLNVGEALAPPVIHAVLGQVAGWETGQGEGVEAGAGRWTGPSGSADGMDAARKKRARSDDFVLSIVDGPPGTSCSMLAATEGADLVCLVTEPTPFGLWDLRLAHDALKNYRLPMAVVVNRASRRMTDLRAFCASRVLPILAEIPDDRRAAEAYAAGAVTSEVLPGHGKIFDKLFRQVMEGRWR